MRIISEIGLNHCGNELEAKYMVSKLLKSDVHGLTFQIKNKIFYNQVRQFYFHNNKTFLENVREKNFYTNMKKRRQFISLELNMKFYKNLIKNVKKRKKLIGFAIGDIEKLKLLSDSGADFFKILSEDFSNLKLINAAINSKAKIIYISTGLNSFKDINNLLKKISKRKIVLIHTRFEKSIIKNQLEKIPVLQSLTRLPVAFSNHSSNYKIYDHLSKFNLSDVFFYVKNYKKRYYPDHSHAISIQNINKHTKKLIKLYE